MLHEQHRAGIAAMEKKPVQDTSMKLICVEGNIGVGKSTLTEELANTLGALAMFEPVTENPYLERYYADPKRYALEMQFWLMSRRFEMHETAIRHIWKTGQSVVMDRSIYGDWVFAKKNHLDGNIDEVGYRAYLHHKWVMDGYLLKPHFVLFLQASPEECLKRLQTRGRGCEKTISLSYLEGLDDLHYELVEDMRQYGSKVLTIPWAEFGNAADIAETIRAAT